MNKNHKISICIPTFNGSNFIYKTILSILNQDYKNTEIIIIDDKSTDDSVKIISDIQKEHPNRINFIKNDKNLGLMKTNNIALKNATGDWLLYIGQDDLLQKDHLTKMSKYFNNTTALIWCRHTLIDSEDKIISPPKPAIVYAIKNFAIKILLKQKNHIPSPGLLINKNKLIKSGGWPEDFKNYGEWHTWIRMAKIGDIAFNKNTIAMYRRHSLNISNSFTKPKTIIELESYFSQCKELARQKKHAGH